MFSYHDWHRVCAKIQGPVASWWNDKAEFSWHLKATKTKFLSLCRLCMKISMQSILKFDVLWLKLKNFVRFVLRFPKLILVQKIQSYSFIQNNWYIALVYIVLVKCVFNFFPENRYRSWNSRPSVWSSQCDMSCKGRKEH